MSKNFDALLNEIDKDTLAQIALATVAGSLVALGGRKLYKKYQQERLLKKYIAQEREKHQSLEDELRVVGSDVIDINAARRHD